MNLLSARRAITDSALAWLAACVAVAMFLPPFLTATTSSVARVVLTAVAVGVALALHFALLAMAVRRMGRSVRAWVGLAVLLFPVGGAAALVLLGWLLHEPGAEHGAPAH
jgi:predicted ABC-type exoprotein transport system permease subunit